MSIVSRCMGAFRNERAQATVEAAFAIPILMLLVLLMLQPGIILYDRIVMESAAADGCRLMATYAGSDDEAYEGYVRRRLSAIPQIDQFHVHSSGCSWHIDMSGSESSQSAKVSISTELKPLPLMDLGMTLMGLVGEGGNLQIEVSHEQQMMPSWAVD